MKKHHKGFFSYTKKERTGIIVLVCLIIATLIIPSFLPSPVMEVDNVTFEKLRTQLASLEGQDARTGDSAMAAYGYGENRTGYVEPREGTLFRFDPNTLPAADWERLGVRARTAQTIRNYVSHGGKFRRPEDLYKIYGLRKEEAERLMPYVAIPESGQPSTRADNDHGMATKFDDRPGTAYDVRGEAAGRTAGSFYGRSTEADQMKPGRLRNGAVAAAIDINAADTSAFIALWGIGSKLASRIVNFRNKLGGFHCVEQVGETYGLPDSTFQAIRSRLQCPDPSLRTLNINTADAVLLDQHPYISRSQANAIVRYREQHGAYQTVDQLLQITILTPDQVEKVRPYLTVQ